MNADFKDPKLQSKDRKILSDSKPKHEDPKNDLRQKAEERLKNVAALTPERLRNLSSEEIFDLLHELRVYQIELEMQNEELRDIQVSLELSRERYFDLYDVAPVGYCSVSESGLILECNLTLAGYLGVSRTKLVNKPFSRFICRDDQDQYYFLRKQFFAGIEQQNCELRLIKSDHSLMWVQLSGTTALNSEGKPYCRFALSDITARKEEEAKQIALFNEVSELKLSLDQHALSKVIEPVSGSRSGAAVSVWDIVTIDKTITLDDAMYSLFGLNALDPSVSATANRRVIHPADQRKTLNETVERISRGESRLDVEFRVLLPDLKIGHILKKILVERSSDGSPARISAVDYDITVTKEEEFLYRKILGALDASAIVATADLQGRITGANELFCKISGYTREELNGQHYRILNSGFHDRSFFEDIWQTIKTGHVWIGEIRAKSKNGSNYWVHTTISPIKSDNGVVESYISVQTDITSRKETEAQMSFISKLATIGELAAGLGHEINNPLSIVSGNLQAIKREIASDTFNQSNIDKKLSSAIIGSERIRDVVKGFRTFSTVDSGVKEKISVKDSIESTIRMVEGIFANDGVMINYTPCKDNLLIQGSSGRLQQVLMNLLVNAKDAFESKLGANISISTALNNGSVLIDIMDNGIGIPENIRTKIFDPFFTTKPGGNGTGLGLAISTKMMNEMGGELKLINSGSSGSTFRMSLPLLKPTVPLVGIQTEVRTDSPDFSNVRAIVVDDEQGIRELVIEMLEDLGLRDIREAQNGAVALEHIQREEFDLVLTDMKMPGMGGLELIKAINSMNFSSKPYIAVVTGGVASALEKEVRDEFRELIDSYVLKPFEEKHLISVLEKVSSKLKKSST